jgi:hypothetical protein
MIISLVLSAVATMFGAISPATATGGIVPTFSKPAATQDGFVVSVNNYTDEFMWRATTNVGSLEKGTPQGQTWVLTVTGLKPGQSATITVTTMLPGLEDTSAIVSGTAIAGDAPLTEERAATSLVFSGKSVKLSADGHAALDALIADLPDGAATTEIVLWVTTSQHPTKADITRAKARVRAIVGYLDSHGVSATTTAATPRAKKAGRAQVTLIYLP